MTPLLRKENGGTPTPLLWETEGTPTAFLHPLKLLVQLSLDTWSGQVSLFQLNAHLFTGWSCEDTWNLLLALPSTLLSTRKTGIRV